MLNTSVLVLNRNYQPIHVTSAKRAFTLLYLGAARVIDEQYRTFDFESWAALSEACSGDDVIRTIDRAIRVPRVILLQIYDRMPRTKVRFSRLNIYARDDNTCQYCGQKLPRTHLNLDHVVPRAQGGRTTWENVVCCCVPCNLAKGARTPDQAGIRLLHAAVRPNWSPTFRAPAGIGPASASANGLAASVAPGHKNVRYREWLPFLGLADASYWNTELVDDDDE